VDEVYTAYEMDARPGLYLKVNVMDTGTGIPPDVLNHIFEPFFTTKGPKKGTGLGLSTVLGIVKGHGGFIRAYSEVGKGSVFSVHLPVGQNRSIPERGPRNAVEVRGKGQTILLVDDEAPIRGIGSTVLAELGFNPMTASDGLEGLLLATENRSRLTAVILDMDMPQMNGITLARALRRLNQDLPIAAMSGRFSEEAQAELLEIGVTAQMAKPFTKDNLAEVLHTLIAPQVEK
jgi:CheY-like chemotaxis protein